MENCSDTCKPIPFTSKNSSEGISLKHSQNEAVATVSSTKTDDQMLSDENVKDSSPDKNTLQNGPSVPAFNKNLVQIVADKSEVSNWFLSTRIGVTIVLMN